MEIAREKPKKKKREKKVETIASASSTEVSRLENESAISCIEENLGDNNQVGSDVDINFITKDIENCDDVNEAEDVKSEEKTEEENIKTDKSIISDVEEKDLSNKVVISEKAVHLESQEILTEKEDIKVDNLIIDNVEGKDESNRAVISEKVEEVSDQFTRLLNKNKNIVSTIQSDEHKLDQIVEKTITLNSKELTKPELIKPYTEAQLKALYTNSELEGIEDFSTQYVDAELKGLSVKLHTLYDLLTNYLNSRDKIIRNTLELEQLRKEYQNLQNELWTTGTSTVSGRAQCQDETFVTASHPFNTATFNRSVFRRIAAILGNVQKLTYENHTLYLYSAEELRLQIEMYLGTVISNCLCVTQVNEHSPISLSLQSEPQHMKPYISEVRLCISVLFAFQRKLIRDAQFLKETREWLSQLVAVLLRIANFQDHLFILNHILRCPAGVGTWGSHFIQVPLNRKVEDSPFSNYQINHVVTILASILSPVIERETFLVDICQSKDNVTEALWVIVDSDGEEDEESSGTSLKENDLVALLNQLPLDDFFRAVLLVQKRNFEDVYDSDSVNEHHLLRYLSFSTVLLRIIHKGLKTYGQSRYNQFTKRLSRLIRHIVQYATDQWENYKQTQDLKDAAMLKRLQVEYDAFFLRAIYYLYSSQKLGAWQFLAVVPYNLVSLTTLWKIFYFLHNSGNAAKDILDPLDNNDYSKKLWDAELRFLFQEKLAGLDDAESYYLLNTFANMALARSDADMEFIKAATEDLLQIGFISAATQELCAKSARILLTHITSKHPHLLSEILKVIKNEMTMVNSLALYLYEELPLTVWNVSEQDLELISRLLLNNDAASNETKLARMILSRLNWDNVDYDLQCNVALLVVQACELDASYNHWGWQMVLRLHIHITDHAFTEIGKVQELERYSVLMKGVREQQPLPIFVSILMTTWGHLVPLICTKGLQLLLVLQTHQKHEAVLFALYQIMPLFVNCQECIINCEPFQNVLTNLLNADRGYISMAKGLIATQKTVLQQFGNMIETQIANFCYYGLESPRCLVRLWINSLVSLPNWNKDCGVMFLLDVIIKTSFAHHDALDVAYNILKELQQCGTPQEQSTGFGSLFKWASGSNTNSSMIQNSLSSYPWFAYMLIEIEFEERELNNGFWKELLIQLDKQTGKVNVDQAIKKAATIKKIASFSSSSLSIYRWAQQALDTPIDHPLLPLFWQKFYMLYLTRIPTTSAVDKGCVGEKFFDGLVNFQFLKKLKRNLQDTVEYYENKVNKKDEFNDDSEKKPFYDCLLRLYRAFILWLEEPRIQEGNLLLTSLPPQYEAPLLGFIMQGSKAPWLEYVDYFKLKEEQNNNIRIWRVSNFREKNNVNQPLPNPGSRIEGCNPIERILRRLSSYDVPKAPPNMSYSPVPATTVDFSSKDNFLKSLEPYFKTLQQFAGNHTLKLSEHKALDCSYQELVPQLYRAVVKKVIKKVPCKGKNQAVHCSGAAVIVLEMNEAEINHRIDHQMQSNRTAYESLLTKSLQSPASYLYAASVTLQETIRMLQQQIQCNPATAELGVELFYHILSLINEETTHYLPTKTLFSICLEKLGQSHIYEVEHEMPRLLEKILNEPNLGVYLAPHFSPSNVGSSNLLLMYSTICEKIGQKYDVAFALLSKFEVESWLNKKQPKLIQRSQFIESIMKAITCLGFDPPIEAMMLQGLYRKHLLTVFEFQFPEHYGEVLMHLLKSSNGSIETSLLPITVWMDILNSLSKPITIHLKVPIREQLRQYAQHQQMLQHTELLETASLLSKHFTHERLQYGLYGLYPKCRSYVDVFGLLLGMTGHGLIVSTLKVHQGELDDVLCEKIWPCLRDMFAPWLVPYSIQNLKENMASWIKQLADDRSVLLPWIPADVALAQKMVNVFFECVYFIIQTLPACSKVLSYIWQWYASCYAHVAVKEHILGPLHNSFLCLPWHNFWPSLMDVEYMLRVVDQYLPECHILLGHIFMSIPWTNWLNNFSDSPEQIKARVHQCFLSLLVKLSNEPNVRSRHPEKIKALLVQAETMNWTVLEAGVFQHVLDWYVMSCDSQVIFKYDPLNLDYRVLQLLKTVSGYTKSTTDLSPDILNKRLLYIRMIVKLISVFASRYKNTISSKENELNTVFCNQLSYLDNVVHTQTEINVIIPEMLCILNINSISHIALRAFSEWISTKFGESIAVRALLQSGMVVTDLNVVAELYEATLTSYFINNVTENFTPTWREVSEVVCISPTKQTELEKILLNSGKLLTLNALLVQRICKCNDSEALLNHCLEWLPNIKLSEAVEPKIPLIWSGILLLALQHCGKDESCTGGILYRFSQYLLQLSNEKQGSGWGRGLLTAIGINKQDNVSMNFKFVCRSLAGYILAQLPDMKGEPQVVRHFANAPSKVGQPGGNTECVKILLSLDFGQSNGKIKECAEMALKQIQDPNNSLHNVRNFLLLLLKQFYSKPYLRDIA